MTMDELASPPGIWPCSDWDKRDWPGVHIANSETNHIDYPLDVSTMTVTATVPWAVDGSVANCSVTIYDPKGFAPKVTARLGGFAGAASSTATMNFTIAQDEVGVFTAVISACQTDADGLSNRDGKARQIVQHGVTFGIWPRAANMAGLTGVAGTNHGTVGWPLTTSVVGDAGTKQSVGDGITRYLSVIAPAGAATAEQALQQNTIFFYCGHGWPDQINPSGWAVWDTLYGDEDPYDFDPFVDCPYSQEYWIAHLPAGALSHCLFACYGGCNTCATRDVSSNLLDATIAKGAKCAMGFRDELWGDEHASLFWSDFWQYAANYDSCDVLTAAAWASQDVALRLGSAGGFDSFEVRNPVKLMPAKFGGW